MKATLLPADQFGIERCALQDYGLSAFELSPRERIEAYLDSRLSNKWEPALNISAPFMDLDKAKPDSVQAATIGDWLHRNISGLQTNYIQDMRRILRRMALQDKGLDDKVLLSSFGDWTGSMCQPTLIKVRKIANRSGNSVLLNIESDRHWGPLRKLDYEDRDFGLKFGLLLWRGAATGYTCAARNGTRIMLVSKYDRIQGTTRDDRIDVGFTPGGCKKGDKFLRNSMSRKEQLAYKYLLVVNGNDKASSLNWVLRSNSVPFMIQPSVESWLLESNLVPWVHFVPIEPDFSDLSQKLDWAEANQDRAQCIARAGRQYVGAWMDPEREQRIEAAVVANYIRRMNIHRVAGGAQALEGCSAGAAKKPP